MEQLQYSVQSGEIAESIKTVRLARWGLGLVIVASVLVQLAGFAMIEFGGVIPRAQLAADGQQPAGIDPDRETPDARTPANRPTSAEQMDRVKQNLRAAGSSSSSTWSIALDWLLPATKFAAMAAAVLLVFTVALTLNLSIAGRRPGLADAVSAFFWSILLLAVLVPWQQVQAGSFASGALFNVTELQRWRAEAAEPVDRTLYYARFLAFPALAGVLAVMTLLKLARSLKAMAGVAESHVSVPTNAQRQ